MKVTLPSMQAVKPVPEISAEDMQLAIELRLLLFKGYSKERIARILFLIRDDNL